MNKRDALLSMIRTRVYLDTSSGERITYADDHGAREMRWMFDFRAVALDPDWLDVYAEEFWERFSTRLPFQVGGMETAALPLVAAIVMKGRERGTKVNGFYIRKSRDRDGRMRQIEGTLTDDPVILVDDLMNSGGSFLKQLKVLEANGTRVSDVVAILAFRDDDAYRALAAKGVQVHHFFTLHDLGMPLETARSHDQPHDLFDDVWKFAPKGAAFEWVVQKSAPVIDASRVYFGTDAGTFYSLNQSDGSIAWKLDVGKHPPGKGIFSSPALHDGMVYFGAYDGTVYALETSTGNVKWKNSDADWIGSSPALAPDLGLLFIGLEFGLWRKRGGIVALDFKTGARKWIDRTPALTHGSPLYIQEEGSVVIGSNDGVVYCYDAKSGKRRWWYATGGDIKTRPAYDAQQRLVLVPSMNSHLYALSADRGDVRWAFECGAGIYSNPLVKENDVLVASLDKSLYSIDLTTGKKRCEFETGGRVFASPVLVDGSLFLGSNDGRLYELDPLTLTPRGYHQFPERLVNAIAHNSTTKRFFVTTIANELYCLKRRSTAVE